MTRMNQKKKKCRPMEHREYDLRTLFSVGLMYDIEIHRQDLYQISLLRLCSPVPLVFTQSFSQFVEIIQDMMQ